jgi:hypothetical protein
MNMNTVPKLDHIEKAIEYMGAPVGCNPTLWFIGVYTRINEIALAKQQAQPEPHPAYRAMYAKQVAEGTTGFYLWEFKNGMTGWLNIKTDLGIFHACNEYRCTDISCYVSKDGEPATRMLRTEAQALQRQLGDTFEWKHPNMHIRLIDKLTFSLVGTYTYRTKATIKLNGHMVTPEQAATEWEANKETHDLWFKESQDSDWQVLKRPSWVANNFNAAEHELHHKQPTWTGSREDVIALLKEFGLLKEGAA